MSAQIYTLPRLFQFIRSLTRKHSSQSVFAVQCYLAHTIIQSPRKSDKLNKTSNKILKIMGQLAMFESAPCSWIREQEKVFIEQQEEKNKHKKTSF